MRHVFHWKRLALVALAILCSRPFIALADGHPDWIKPLPPFRIAGNLYYVGSVDLAAYLVVTPKGNILINSNLSSSPRQIRASVEQLGFHFSDTRILLISHAHFDHCAGSAEIKRLTGAKYMVMDADIPTVESGGRKDFAYGKEPAMRYPATHVDRVLHDGDTVALGGTVLTAHKTAGHTRGNTTWTLDETDKGRTLHVVIVGSPYANSEYKLAGSHPSYPGIEQDFERQFETLRHLPCDIFLGAHGGYFDLSEKLARLRNGDANAFIDPEGYKRFVTDREAAFHKKLQRDRGL